MTRSMILLFLLFLPCQGFVHHAHPPLIYPSSRSSTQSIKEATSHRLNRQPFGLPSAHKSTTRFSTRLSMAKGFQSFNKLNIWTKTFLFMLVVTSPIGRIVMRFLNSILVLAVVSPLLASTAYSAYERFSTVSGDCPNCSSSVRVSKRNSNGAEPVQCASCGYWVQANRDNSGIEFGPVTNGHYKPSSYASIFEILDPDSAKSKSYNGGGSQKRSDDDIIDVEIEDWTEKPFQ